MGGPAPRWRTMSRSEREREYSPSSVLPDGDYRPFVDEYRRASDEAWSTARDLPGVRTLVLPYGASDTQTVDVALPPTDLGSAPPLLVFLHGGYWQELSKLDSRFAAVDCVERGWAFSAVDYTLAPDASLDEIVAECRLAVRALHGACDELGVDRDRITVAGSSAGAHLAAMVALDPAASDGHVAATVLISGVYELEPLVDTTINDALGLGASDARRNSPLTADLLGFPRTLVAHGQHETVEFIAQSHAMAQALDAAEVPVSVLAVPDRNHFDVVLDLARPGTPLGDAVATLMD